MSNSTWFRKLALTATIATYLLIFVGGLVRVAGAGLGCPDWPRCFGRWLPPTSIEQLPPDLDPALFNITLAWIEYGNRLLGVTVGLLIAAVGVSALARFRRHRVILYPAVAAAVLTAIQGWQGAVVVASELRPIVVTVHTALALVIVSLLTYLTAQCYLLPTASHVAPQSPSRWWLRLLWLVALIQVILGTQVREALEVIKERLPLLSESDRLTEVGVVNHLHLGGGLILVCVTWLAAALLLRHRSGLSPWVSRAVAAMVVLATLQLFLGLSFLAIGRTPLTQLIHLTIASLYVGSLILASVTASRKEIADESGRL